MSARGEINMTDPSNPLGMKSISEYNALGLAEDYKKRIFKMDWVFSSVWDKLFLVVMLVWSCYSVWRIFFNG